MQASERDYGFKFCRYSNRKCVLICQSLAILYIQEWEEGFNLFSFGKDCLLMDSQRQKSFTWSCRLAKLT